MKHRIIALATLIALTAAGLAVLAPSPAVQAAQPALDTLDLDERDCIVSLEWIDGRQVTETIEVYVNDIRTLNLVINDVVGDQSAIVASFEADEGDEIVAVLTPAQGDEYETSLTVGECPKPSPTPSPSPTATPSPTSTPSPAPTATPVVIVVTVQVPSVRPPSTGDAGLSR